MPLIKATRGIPSARPTLRPMELDDPFEAGDAGAGSDGASLCFVSVASDVGVLPPEAVALLGVVVVLISRLLVVDALDVDG